MKTDSHSSIRAILYAFLANVGIFITKLVTAIITNSGSMLAESIHSLADTINQILLYVGLKRSGRQPDKKHPLGYGKAIYVWSFLVAILLFSMGGIFSIYEGYHKLREPVEIQSLEIAFTVLGISIVLEMFSLKGALKEISLIKKDKTLKQWIREAKDTELIVVFGEDIAALLGLVFAFIFILIAYLLNNFMYDAIGTVIIGFLLIIISLFISIRVKSMIIGESALLEVELKIREIMQQTNQVEEIMNLISLQLGKKVMIAAKLKLKQNLSLQEAIDVINSIEQSIKKNIPEVQWSFMEPDIKD